MGPDAHPARRPTIPGAHPAGFALSRPSSRVCQTPSGRARGRASKVEGTKWLMALRLLPLLRCWAWLGRVAKFGKGIIQKTAKTKSAQPTREIGNRLASQFPISSCRSVQGTVPWCRALNPNGSRGFALRIARSFYNGDPWGGGSELSGSDAPRCSESCAMVFRKRKSVQYMGESLRIPRVRNVRAARWGGGQRIFLIGV